MLSTFERLKWRSQNLPASKQKLQVCGEAGGLHGFGVLVELLLLEPPDFEDLARF